jgi:hypothetical protein
MAYSHDIRCPTDQFQPVPVGFCDYCNFKYPLAALSWAMEWRGSALANLRFLVCSTCLDVPNEQFRIIVIGPDPAPLQDARPGFTQSQMNQGASDDDLLHSGWGLGEWSGGEWSIGNGPDFVED